MFLWSCFAKSNSLTLLSPSWPSLSQPSLQNWRLIGFSRYRHPTLIPVINIVRWGDKAAAEFTPNYTRADWGRAAKYWSVAKRLRNQPWPDRCRWAWGVTKSVISSRHVCGASSRVDRPLRSGSGESDRSAIKPRFPASSWTLPALQACVNVKVYSVSSQNLQQNTQEAGMEVHGGSTWRERERKLLHLLRFILAPASVAMDTVIEWTTWPFVPL